ncbi:ATP-binding/permease protein [Candidatus Photodesmus blepharus]|uniref:ATP-binding/permease protein n=1 Tax=Candidatus Photodesmus blepharonis TaxID=1179155 RepID=A0A084CPA7_9GAMM|nr:cysteine/glutathione ABC transporter ATP-binding protein/permease CydC [Candidatus Photodesmus blepharus]KEY91636.1 ATP-binding/permease protein [Candidatus Photodesmus blepharus]
MRELFPYFKLYKKHWVILAFGMILTFLALFSSIALLTLSAWIISSVTISGLSVAYKALSYTFPRAFIIFFSISRTLSRWSEQVVNHNITFKLLSDLRVLFFKKIAPLIPGKISNLRDADLLNRLISDINSMDHIYLRLITPVIVGIACIITLTIFLCSFSISIGLTLGAILLLLLLIWPVIFYKLGKRNGVKLVQYRTQLRTATLDWLQCYAELTLFGSERRYYNAILKAQQRLISKQLVDAHLSGLAKGLLILINGLILLLMLWFSSSLEIGQPSSVFVIVVFAYMASFELLTPIAGAFQFLGQTMTSAHRINQILLSEPEIHFPKKIIRHNPNYSIKFKNVSFQYPNSTQQALCNINLIVPFQQKIAIVGQTGSGKSTLLQLLFRYWSPQEGIISIADKSLNQWNESQLRQAISVVNQRVHILNATLRNNLIMASSSADDHLLSEVLIKVGLEPLLYDQGLDTWLGNGGRQLSGGEKRRIDIARALLHNGPILLLDEPTEGLDKHTEQEIIQLLESNFLNKTVIFITHRLVNLDKMNMIFLIEEGKIIESGSHQDLLSKKGRYHKLIQVNNSICLH